MKPIAKYLLKSWVVMLALSQALSFMLAQQWVLLYLYQPYPVQAHSSAFLPQYVGLFMCISSATMFFNVKAKIRKAKPLRWLSFFFLPLLALACTAIFGPFQEAWRSTAYTSTMLPVFVWLAFTYVLFSKWVKQHDMFEQIRNNQHL